LGDRGVDVRIILKRILKKWVVMNWIELAQDRDRWWAIVNVVMNFRVLLNAGNFLTGCKPVSFSRRTLLHGVGR
jgi:hypothetical protein